MPLNRAVPVAPATGSTPGLIRTFLLDHERLLIILILAVLCFWGYSKYADIREKHDSIVLAQAKLAADAQAKVVEAQAQQVAVDAAQLQILQTKIQSQNEQLTQANATLASALATRQKTDSTLPLPELAVRWTSLVPEAIPVASASGVTVSPSGAVATVQALEQVPSLKTELDNETQLKMNDDILITSQTKSIFDLTAQTGGLQKQNVLDKQQCVDEKKVMSDQFRKSKLKWFKWGVVVGFVGRQLIKTQTGW